MSERLGMLTKEELLHIVKPIPPFKWVKYGLTVTGDGFLNDGTRVHSVKEQLNDEPILIDNAFVISELD